VFNFNHSAPRASYPAPKSALEAQRQDLDYFAKAMASDRAFSSAARAAVEAQVSAHRALPEALPSAKLQVALMQVMASADSGHSRVEPIAGPATLILPVRVTRFEEGLYVMRVAAPFRDIRSESRACSRTLFYRSSSRIGMQAGIRLILWRVT
jgi:hypothetical protein